MLKNLNKIGKIEKREITAELQESYLDYAMSVIISRALPDVRDGLKPVHRRILWAAWEEGLTHNAKFRKSANIVGQVMARYHPHGDSAIYDSLARMAQDFSLRYPLIQGQGNWGSIDGDAPAAMRYTEARLAKISDELLTDVEKETVDWNPNYDGSHREPKVLPAKLPNLLINGSMGIAVGMATNIPPNNLSEVIDATLHLIDHPKSLTEDLMTFIQGPDFPTGGIIYDKKAITEAYASGKGAITARAKTEIIEKKSGYFSIIITEIPYQVNKSELIIKIAELVQDKKIEGIRDVRDESGREGLRIVIELKNDASPQKILNQLFNHTDLQKNFNMNMLALGHGIQPQTMSVKDVLEAYVEHRQEVVRRRTAFELAKAKERAHILEGLAKALSAIDKIIAVIKKSKDTEEAHKKLMENFKLTGIQATAILEMKLRALAALERQKIEDELKEKKKLIAELEAILKSGQKILNIIKEELIKLKEKHGDERKTKVVAGGLKEFKEEDLVPQEESIITLSKSGYIKRVNPTIFKSQKRGGTGLIGSEVGEEDFLSHFISANTHNNILFFTDHGKVFQTKVHEIPVGSRIAKGKLIQNFLDVPPGETISAIVNYPIGNQQSAINNQFLVMATKKGVIKKTPVEEFLNVRRSGIIAINLEKAPTPKGRGSDRSVGNDRLKWVKLSSGKDEIILATKLGQAIRFKESQLRSMGRTAAGVKAIKLKNNDFVAGLDIIKKEEREKRKEERLLVVTENGFAKQTELKEYKIQSRGGSGIKTSKINAKTGLIVASRIITNEEEILALSAKGQIIRTKISDIRTAGRATSGVRIMKLKQGDKVIGVVCL
ncbi:MAG: DNA gyrase subunit A [Patescibacteria group bacterium]